VSSASLASAQFGMRQGGSAEAAMGGMNDVDIAMKGWQELSQSPEKMQDLWQSFKDPEVMAKAKEMLNDPVYMAAAKKKVAQLQAQAQSRGMLDANGMPVPGAASAAAGAMGMSLDDMVAAGGAATADDPSAARDWELRNAERYRAGELNDAELGMANLKQAARDPAMLKQAMDMFRDPSAMAEVKKMMADPSFKAQAEQMMAQLKASGQMPDLSQMAAQMGGGMGGMGGMGGAESELDRLRRENAALRARAGMRDEL